MALSKQKEPEFATMQLDFQVQMSSFVTTPQPVISANSARTADWNALMTETEVEWAKTLEYLGR